MTILDQFEVGAVVFTIRLFSKISDIAKVSKGNQSTILTADETREMLLAVKSGQAFQLAQAVLKCSYIKEAVTKT